MSEPDLTDSAPSSVEAQPEEAQPFPTSGTQTHKSEVEIPKEPDIPRQSPFAKEPPEPGNAGSKEANQWQQPPFPEREPTLVEKPRVSVVENPNPDLPQTQPQSSLSELEQPRIGQTAAPGLPSVFDGPDAFGFKLSVLGVELAAIRTALKGRLARSLSGFNFPGKVRSKG